MEAEGWLNSKMGLVEFKKGLNPFNLELSRSPSPDIADFTRGALETQR